jgi:hypothetical protein
MLENNIQAYLGLEVCGHRIVAVCEPPYEVKAQYF